MTSILREGGNKVKKDNQHHPMPDDLEQVLDEIRCNALSDADIDCLLDAVEPSVADPSVYDKSECAEELSVRRISADSSLGEGAEKCVPSKENLARKKSPELHKNHRAKMRQRFLDEGLEGFQKHNILELLLFYAIPRVDTNEIAHRLLNAYHGNLSEVLGADVKSLMKIEGVGESAAILLSMMPQVFRVYREELMRRKGVIGREAVEQYTANRFTGLPVEKVMIACLGSQWDLLGDEFVSTGSVNFSSVDRRAIIEVCLRYNATAAVIAHNHPRGTAIPSKDDINTTIEVRRALDVIGVRLVDHIIVAGEDYISLSSSRKYFTLF